MMARSPTRSNQRPDTLTQDHICQVDQTSCNARPPRGFVLVRVKRWERYGLKSWIEAAKKRLHHNVLAIALANKLARIAWAVLNKGRAFECVKTEEMASGPA